MLIQATKYRARVQFKKPGKFYNAGTADELPFNNDERSSYPFDEVDLEIGQSFDTDGVELVNVREFTPMAQPVEQPAHA